MTREDARQEIRSEWRRIIPTMTGEAKQKVNGKPSYICPLCGHGTHGDGLCSNPRSTDGNGLHCFGCGFSGDIIDLYQQTTGADYNTALSLLADELRLTIDPYRPDAAADFAPAPRNDRTASRRSNESGAGNTDTPPEDKSAGTPLKTPVEESPDYTEYYKACRERLQDPAALAYLAGRGISEATAAAYWIGFDPAADPSGKGYPAPRIIIPVNAGHYIARATDPRNKYKKLNPTGSTPGIFNLKALYAQGVQEVFVTEGAFDALSIIEAGATAIATNSAANAAKLIEQLERERTEATLILAFDNDEAGKKAAQTIRTGLQRLNISYVFANICGGRKDPNEALTTDRAAFIAAVEAAKRQAAARPDNISYYIDALMADEIAQFKRELRTGYPNLDKQSGGLYAGLYCIAAISSLGKTTFAAQMADQIAAAGNDVLFFSLEQSRLEMVSKSLARITAQHDMENAVSSLSIRRGYLPKAVLEAAEEYKQQVADRLSIVEGNFSCNISFIGDYIRQYIRRTGTKPVVFIDYLQILQPEQNAAGRTQTTKETVDSTVTELKRISREHGLTVFIISSVNRANYLTPIDFESLKESGGIEYTCDVVWGLQLQCLNDPVFDKQNNIKERRQKIKEAKAATPRKIELCCLKNRYGISSYSAYFDYYPAADLFTECSEADIDFTPEYTPRKTGRKL